MTRVVITAMLAWLAVGVWAVPARAAVDIHIGIPGVVIVPPLYYYDYPRYDYPRYIYLDSEPRYDKHHRRHHHHGHGHHHHGHGHHYHGHGHHHHGHGR
jgi:hypothetical protein